jgi:hypothetical protein
MRSWIAVSAALITAGLALFLYKVLSSATLEHGGGTRDGGSIWSSR